MTDPGFHFAQPIWLLGLLLVPLVIAWLWYSAPVRRHGLETRYADGHLLPFLQGEATTRVVRSKRPLLAWIAAWCLLLIAMAGPRLGYRQMNPFEAGADLVILLDISRSMNIGDVPPSRLHRARQEIQDLVRAKQGIRVGLIAFATIAHVVTPLTDDGDSLLHQLPGISTDLVRLQGSRLSEALRRAESLLAGQRKDVARNILLISDGDFADKDIEQQLEELNKTDTRLHVLAIGTKEGGPVPGMMNTNREPVLSLLDEDGLRHLAKTSGGIFRVADYRDDDVDDIVDAILSHATARQNEKMQTLVWNEYFYWAVLPAMLILLFLLRPGGNISRFGHGGSES
jgi:Ca-activated chloride channel family protein